MAQARKKVITKILPQDLTAVEGWDDVRPGAGLEEATADDYAIPYLTIIQKMSPQVDEDEGAYIEGAKPGMFFNTVTEEVIAKDSGLKLIPVMFRKEINEWTPREQGGGLVQVHPGSSNIMDRAVRDESTGRMLLPNGHLLVDTARHFIVVVDGDGQFFQAVLALTSTQLKKSRKWNSKQSTKTIATKNGLVKAPTFAFAYPVTTIPESNEKGSWHGIAIGEGEQISPELFKECLDFYKAIKAGDVKVQDIDPDATAETKETDAF